jgi:mannose-6-phosphate isomerase-like protein (cupin superfamily)
MTATSGRVVRNSDVVLFANTGRRVQLFYGDEHGFGLVTIAVSSGTGGGVTQHRHQCSELFVVVDGQGTYCV